MFSLKEAKLIRLNDDGSEGKIFQTNESSLSFGSSAQSDCCVDEPDSPSQLLFKIYKDDFGTVMIANDSEQQLLVNDEPVSGKRPLISNSRIVMPNDVQFRWFYSFRDSEFVSQTNEQSCNSPEVDINSNCDILTMNVDPTEITASNESQIIDQISSSHRSEDDVHDRKAPTSPMDENNNEILDEVDDSPSNEFSDISATSSASIDDPGPRGPNTPNDQHSKVTEDIVDDPIANRSNDSPGANQANPIDETDEDENTKIDNVMKLDVVVDEIPIAATEITAAIECEITEHSQKSSDSSAIDREWLDCSLENIEAENTSETVQTESEATIEEIFVGKTDEAEELSKAAIADPIPQEMEQPKKPANKRKHSHSTSEQINLNSIPRGVSQPEVEFQDELPPPRKRTRKTEVERLREVTRMKEFADVFSVKRGNRRSMASNKLNMVTAGAESPNMLKIRGRAAETVSKSENKVVRSKRSSI